MWRAKSAGERVCRREGREGGGKGGSVLLLFSKTDDWRLTDYNGWTLSASACNLSHHLSVSASQR